MFRRRERIWKREKAKAYFTDDLETEFQFRFYWDRNTLEEHPVENV